DGGFRGEGGRCRQRRYLLCRGASDGRGQRSIVPAGQGIARVRSGALRRQEPVREPWPARRGGTAPDAIGERHLPWLDRGPARAAFLSAPVARHENEAPGGSLQSS